MMPSYPRKPLIKFTPAVPSSPEPVGNDLYHWGCGGGERDPITDEPTYNYENHDLFNTIFGWANKPTSIDGELGLYSWGTLDNTTWRIRNESGAFCLYWGVLPAHIKNMYMYPRFDLPSVRYNIGPAMHFMVKGWSYTLGAGSIDSSVSFFAGFVDNYAVNINGITHGIYFLGDVIITGTNTIWCCVEYNNAVFGVNTGIPITSCKGIPRKLNICVLDNNVAPYERFFCYFIDDQPVGVIEETLHELQSPINCVLYWATSLFNRATGSNRIYSEYILPCILAVKRRNEIT